MTMTMSKSNQNQSRHGRFLLVALVVSLSIPKSTSTTTSTSAFQMQPQSSLPPLSQRVGRTKRVDLALAPFLPATSRNSASIISSSSSSSTSTSLASSISPIEIDPFLSLLQEALTQATSATSTITTSPTTSLLLLLITTLTISFQILSNPPPNYRLDAEPYLRGKYDPSIAQSYYSRRPLLVLRRFCQILRLSNSFVIRILIDKYIYRDEGRNAEEKGKDLLQLIQNIGPTAIKVGQALSVRQDLIPEYYAKALVELQDNVPPFDSEEAVELIRSELGERRWRQIKNVDFSKPVASASIGQVYRGVISVDVDVDANDNDNENNGVEDINAATNGSANTNTKTTTTKKDVEVAIKVQRPNVLAEIALDLYIVRSLAPTYQKLTKTSTDLQSLANEWGRGFIDELTYTQEQYNTMEFNAQMKQKNLAAITAPVVLREYSTDRVLTTQWVNGRRLDESTEDDVARLCGVALNAYLVMLLETGTLHCDPHPGNLLRTDDGKLCILDFGMTLSTPKDLQYSLLEFIAHLTAENYDDVPYDLVKLDFLREDKVDLLVKTGALEPLYYFLRQANQGGGGTKVRERIFDEYREKYPGADEDELRQYMRAEIKDSQEKMAQKASAVTGVTMKVEDLQRENSDAFRIPEWFLYTSRAFLTLEGISLQADPDFSIVKSCFPYVAKRLLGDDSPRSQKALRDLIYGKDDDLNTEKISELAEGFTKYTTTTKIVSQGGDATINLDTKKSTNKESNRQSTEATITLAKDSADILLAPKGNLVQNLIVEESATALSAQVKDTLREVLLSNPERIRSSLPLGLGNFLPKGPVEQLEPFLTKSRKEEKVQALTEKLSSLASLPSTPTASELGEAIRNFDQDSSAANDIENMSPEEIAVFWKAIRENVPVYAPQVATLGGKFASVALGKVSENIDTVIASTKESDDLADQLVRNSARSISAAAKEGANALKPLVTVKEE